ncbi:MAG: XRE family transcriptional regulator [Planctomycetota bacterium]
MNKTTDGVKIFYEMFIRGNPESEARVEEDRKKIRLIVQLRDLREKAGLTQSALALKLHTSLAAIQALEDIDSDEHKLEDLQQAVSALGMELQVRIVKKSTKPRRRKSAPSTAFSAAHV